MDLHSFVWFRYNGVEESYKNEEELVEIQLETSGLRTKLYRRSQSKEKKGLSSLLKTFTSAIVLTNFLFSYQHTQAFKLLAGLPILINRF